MAPLRILVVDDHQIVREGLRWMLGEGGEVEVVAEADSAAAAMDAIERSRPDVVILDIHLPDRNGLEVLRDMRERFPAVPVVMLSMSDDPEYVEEAVRTGAVGYLVKNAPAAELVRAVKAAAGGDGYIQAEVTRPLLLRFAHDVRTRGDVPSLSPRGVEIVGLVAEGLADKQIAAKLGITEATVKGYLRQVYERLGAADRAQAVAIALRHRLID